MGSPVLASRPRPPRFSRSHHHAQDCCSEHRVSRRPPRWRSPRRRPAQVAAPAAKAAIPGCAPGSLKLVEDGVLTVGADNPAYPPWFGGDEKKPWKVSDPYSGKGYESAVAYAIAAQLGFPKSTVKWTYVPFNNSYKPGQEAVRLLHQPGLVQPERARGRRLLDVATTSSTRPWSG